MIRYLEEMVPQVLIENEYINPHQDEDPQGNFPAAKCMGYKHCSLPTAEANY